ncbi:hypothetical protein [Novosphingobium sp.]|uniref:hypothetical protein n=1 Tax=Novosphingobium sp. TaxID=1874826 RepID=UPI0038B7F206
MRGFLRKRPRSIVVGPLTDADAIALHRAIEQLRRSPARLAHLRPPHQPRFAHPLAIVAALATSAASGAAWAWAAIHWGFL